MEELLAGPNAYKQVNNVERPMLTAIGRLITRNIMKLTVRIITDVAGVSILNKTFYSLLDFLKREAELFIIVSIEKTNMKKPLIGTAR